VSRYQIRVSEKEFDVKVDSLGENYDVSVNGKKKSVEVQKLGGSRMLLLIDNQPHEVDIRANGYESRRIVFAHGTEIELEIEDYRIAQARKVAGMKSGAAEVKNIKAPMPGLILEVKVGSGDKVRAQQPLLVIEAMKMENIIKSPAEAVVKRIATATGKSVEKNDLLIEFE